MTTSTNEYRRLDFNKINNRITKIVSSEVALKDITPIQWANDVLSGEKKVVITKRK